MHTIAVCDDEPKAARYIAQYVKKLFDGNRHPVDVEWYTSPLDLSRQLGGGVIAMMYCSWILICRK